MPDPSINENDRRYFAIKAMESGLNRYHNEFNQYLPAPEDYAERKAQLAAEAREKIYKVTLSGGESDILSMSFPFAFTEDEVASMVNLIQDVDILIRQILEGGKDGQIADLKEHLNAHLTPELLDFRMPEDTRKKWYLVRGMREGYEGAKRKVFKDEKSGIMSIVKRQHLGVAGLRAKLTKDEIMHTGLNAVERMAHNFDPNKNISFSTHYRERVYTDISAVIQRNDQTPDNNSSYPELRRFGSIYYKLHSSLGHEPGIKRLLKDQELKKFSSEQIEEYLKAFQEYSTDSVSEEEIVRWIKQLDMQGLIALLRNALTKQEIKEIRKALKREQSEEGEFSKEDISEDILVKLKRYCAFKGFTIPYKRVA
ncbi:hypothetical protein ACFL6I_22245 [candidate division KSB1 bacterium]